MKEVQVKADPNAASPLYTYASHSDCNIYNTVQYIFKIT